ncbi:amino acid ABC transporter permease [Natronomonas marina]|jgi:polar amino acid transport system permease protein|uniref:amino acid ABC transporter permease n=1 Tax=Natronomonas marina TaxID=2961939 RepID=UPI0020C997B3|nr:amino acid ABC transporter permease [Natronomonas marina]
MSERTVRGVELGEIPGTRRLLLFAVGVVFWGWLLVRWTHDLFVAPGVNTSDREPFVPPEIFANGAASLEKLAAGGGPLAGVYGTLAGLFDFLAFGMSVMPELATGARLTVLLTVLSILLGLVIAVPLAVARTYGGAVSRWVALTYTELLRGTPLLAQLFVLYFGLPTSQVVRLVPGVGTGIVPRAAVWVAVIGFTINSSAYQAEYIRSALQSVESGQMTAARSVGLSRLESIRHVILPQGLRYAIPGWTNELVYLVKYSSLAAFIAVTELFKRADSIASDTIRVIDIYLWVAILYLALVLTLSVAMSRFEARVSIPGVGSPGERD